jgi:hypothetical protein
MITQQANGRIVRVIFLGVYGITRGLEGLRFAVSTD